MRSCSSSPHSGRDANTNLAEFISLAKEELTAFTDGGAWDNDRWENKGTVVVFATKTAPLGPHSFTPMADPFKQFAKAYIPYRYSHRPVKRLDSMLQALRCIEAGLVAACGCAEVEMLTGAVMDVCADKCREFYTSEGVRCNTGRHIQAIFDFVREKNIVPSLKSWRTPFRKPSILTEELGIDGRAHRESKLPSNSDMLMVADLFAQADDVENLYFSSILILLMAAPSRITEVLRLPTDCIQWEADEQGTPQMYLRWRAVKGKGATKKWVVPVMHDVVQEAVQRLLKIGMPAREGARFAFEHPEQFMPHPGCLADPTGDSERPLMPVEFGAAIGRKVSGATWFYDEKLNSTLNHLTKGLKSLVVRGATSYRDLAEYVLETYRGAFWPYIDEERTVKTWEALCLHRECEFHNSTSARYFSWRLPSSSEVISRFGSDERKSLFARRGMSHPDGTVIKLTTHQVRHWLSTMSERAGMDEHTLAQWAGRANVRDNRHYDHRSPEERLEAASEILQIKELPLLERFKHRQSVRYEELGVDRLGTAKATLYGMCVHDYAMAPCQKQRECMTCKEHVCIKGDHVTLERIRLLEEQTEALLLRAQQAHEEGDFGADRWVDNHKWKLAHVKAMRVALEHPSVPDGTILRIPEGHDPSAIRRTLIELGMVEIPVLEAISPRLLPMALD